MPYNAGTNRKATDADRYFALRLEQDDSNTINIFDGSITTGTSVVNTCAQAARNALIPGYETEFSALTVWGFTKSASNPLVAVDGGIGGSLEFYPPLVIRENSNTWVAIGKVKNETWGTTSSDGITWSAPQKYIAIGSSGQWDDIVCSPGVFAIENGVYKILTVGYGDSPAYNYKVGYAYNNTFQAAGWTKSASYILDVSTYNSVNGTNWDSIRCGDAIKVGNRWYYFGTVFNNAFTNGELCYGIGAEGGNFEDVVLDTRIATFTQINKYYPWIANPSVFKHPDTGEYCLLLTAGYLRYDASKSNQAIYIIESGRSDEPIFTKAGYRSFPIMVCNEVLQWENNQVYCSRFVKDNNGVPTLIGSDYYMYYAGHENTASFTYSGAMCLATIPTIP